MVRERGTSVISESEGEELSLPGVTSRASSGGGSEEESDLVELTRDGGQETGLQHIQGLSGGIFFNNLPVGYSLSGAQI